MKKNIHHAEKRCAQKRVARGRAPSLTALGELTRPAPRLQGATPHRPARSMTSARTRPGPELGAGSVASPSGPRTAGLVRGLVGGRRGWGLGMGGGGGLVMGTRAAECEAAVTRHWLGGGGPGLIGLQRTMERSPLLPESYKDHLPCPAPGNPRRTGLGHCGYAGLPSGCAGRFAPGAPPMGDRYLGRGCRSPLFKNPFIF